MQRCPTVVFLHGAGFDHSAWALHSRWFAHHGFGVLAADLPGHGRSQGKPLTSIEAMADWTVALLDAAGAKQARADRPLDGLADRARSRRAPSRARQRALPDRNVGRRWRSAPICSAPPEANDHDAIDMVSIWGLGFPAEIGGSLAPGVWMHGGAERMLEAAAPGVLHADLAACNAYRNALRRARRQHSGDADPRRARHDDGGEERPRARGGHSRMRAPWC